MKSRLIAALAVIALSIGGAVGVAAPAGAATPLPGLTDARITMLNLLDDYRDAAGAGSIGFGGNLNAVAQDWAQQLAAENDGTGGYSIRHRGDAGLSVTQCPSGTVLRSVGENITSGSPGDYRPSEAMEAWRNSPGHYANMIGDYTVVGFGAARSDDGATFYVTNFARCDGDPAPSTALRKNRAFVTSVYEDFLGRGPSASERSSWGALLTEGSASRDELTQKLSRSKDWLEHVITGFYRDTLGRSPDAEGLRYWIGVARDGYPIEKIASEFYGSSEYFAGFGRGSRATWVEDLYAKLMHRDGDSRGVEYWVDELRRGVQRTVVAHSFYQSEEKLGLRVSALYEDLLGRSPDGAGRAYWKGVVQARGDLVLATWLAASQEYYDRAG